jgi:uncharacterized membrane protein YfcA
MEYLVILPLAILAGTISGVIGTGSSIMLMPALVWLFGPQHAVPIMAIASVMGNIGRVLAWWRLIDWAACAAYASTAVIGVVAGVHTLLAIPAGVAEIALGGFFLALVPVRRWLATRSFSITLVHLALLGGPIGFLTGVVVSTGPLTVPLFTFYGLAGGAFLGTEGAGSLAVYAVKLAAFQTFGALPLSLAAQGLVAGAALLGGAFVARSMVVRMPPAFYRNLIDGVMLVAGVALLSAAAR